MRALLAALVCAVLATVGTALAQDVRWTSLEDGLKAAKKSGKPLLVITMWRNGVCSGCDSWQDRVPRDPDVAKQLRRFEQAEWLYDGLGGKVIAWTREHGGTSDDPSVQAFVVTPSTGSVARAPRDTAYVPAEFAKWLTLQADAFEREQSETKVSFEPADVVNGRCRELEAARSSGKPTLLYVLRTDRADSDKAAKAQAAACRKFEKSALDSDVAQKASEGWVRLKLDLADAAQAAVAKSLGVDKAPTLLAFVPGEDKPQDLGSAPDGAALAFKLKKLAAKR